VSPSNFLGFNLEGWTKKISQKTGTVPLLSIICRTLLLALVFLMTSAANEVLEIQVMGGGEETTNGRYKARQPNIIPTGFTTTCDQMNWNDQRMWQQLTDGKTTWYEHENGSYVYRNVSDGKWWIDAPDGGGVYIAAGDATSVPMSKWNLLPGATAPAPTVQPATVQPDSRHL